MINKTQSYAACLGCHFIPFCASEGTNQPSLKQTRFSAQRLRRLKRKEVLYLPQNKFQNFYAVQHGTLKTYEMEAKGKELIRNFYFAGEILGYEAIATGYFPFSAIALEDTLICEVPYDNFLKLIYSKPALQKHSFHLISKQLNVGTYLAATHAEQRLAAFLIDLSTRLPRSQAQLAFVLPISRQDIGNYLRLTAETISRIFSRLQKSKILAITHKRIQIMDLEKLQLIADGLI